MRTFISLNLAFTTFFLFFCSCNAQDNENGMFSTMSKVDEYTLYLPEGNTINSWTQKGYVDSDSTSYLYYHDSDANEILVYNVDDRSLTNTITLVEDGPGGVGRARGLSVENADRLWMSPIGRAGSYVISAKGEPVEWIPYQWEAEQMADYTEMGNNPYRNIVFDEEVIYIPQRIPMYGYRPPTVDHAPIVKYSTVTKKMELMSFRYPTDYYEKEMPVFFTLEAVNDKLLFGLVASHDVHVIDKETGALEIKTVRSKYIEGEIKSMAGLGGVDEIMMYNAGEPDYPSVIPDPYRNLIYRIARLPPEDPETVKQKFNQLHWTPDRFTIIVCDENLNVLLEYEFPSRLYFPHGIFVDQHGINIPKTHPEFYVTRGKEDEMLYDVFIPE